MNFQRIAISAAFAAGLAALPLSPAKAQYYSFPYACNPSLVIVPFCIAANIYSGIGAVATELVTGPYTFPYYAYPYLGQPNIPPPTVYYPAGFNGSPYAFYDARAIIR